VSITPFALYRIIQIYLKQGKQKSKLLEEQRIRVNGSDVPVMALRFKEVHMMWLTCDVVSRKKRGEGGRARIDRVVICRFERRNYRPLFPGIYGIYFCSGLRAKQYT